MILVLTGALGVLTWRVHANSPSYLVTDLGTLGGDHSEAVAVNDSGMVVGYSTIPNSDRYYPFVYVNGTMVQIGSGEGSATGVNRNGQVTGYMVFPGATNTDAFLYSAGSLQDLGGLPGYSNMPYSVSYAINSAGDIAGESKAEAMVYRGGQMVGFSRRSAQTAYGMNDRGDLVGILSTMTHNHAFAFFDNHLTDLGTLDGDVNGVSVAGGVNDNRQVVGVSWLSGNSTNHAFVYSNGVMQDLGTLQGGTSAASGINAAGDIVGVSDGVGFLYRNGAMADLNTLIIATPPFLKIERASAINNNGQIVGTAVFTNLGEHAVLLTPQP
jgi:probable HAF family extracellular repeat protein